MLSAGFKLISLGLSEKCREGMKAESSGGELGRGLSERTIEHINATSI